MSISGSLSRVTPSTSTPPKAKKRRSHVMPRRPLISLHEPGWLRTADVLTYLGLSHSTLNLRINAGTVPAADGKDGRLNYWRTDTIRKFLEQRSVA